VLLHVLEPPRAEKNGVTGGLALLRRQDARVLLNRMRQQARDVWIETLVTRGEPAQAIVSLAQDFECSLIVMGMQGNSQAAKGKGRVADQVSRHAGCRVLCIQSLPDRETTPDRRQVQD
jgi:nucleotide-binding universal stress UspA family protein